MFLQSLLCFHDNYHDHVHDHHDDDFQYDVNDHLHVLILRILIPHRSILLRIHEHVSFCRDYGYDDHAYGHVCDHDDGDDDDGQELNVIL